MIIIADSGSTKCDWALVEGREVKYAQSVGLNPFFFTDADLHATIAAALTEARDVDEVLFYGSGCGLESNKARLSAAFASLFPAARVVVDTDLTGAAIALFGQGKGVAAILGTGANAGLVEGGKVLRTPLSLGYMLGDNGSGAALGLRLMTLYLKGKLTAELAAELEGEYGLTYPLILENVYKRERPNRFFASLSPFISRHRHSEPIATMLEEEFSEFFAYFIEPFLATEGDLPVRIVGSVAYHYEDTIRSVAARRGIVVDEILLKPLDRILNCFAL